MLGLDEIARRLEQATGIRSGFPSTTDYLRFQHVVELDGLCREKLVDFRFRAAYGAARGEAVRITRLDFLVEPIRDARRVVTGYEFGFAAAATAAAFRDGALAAMRAKRVA